MAELGQCRHFKAKSTADELRRQPILHGLFIVQAIGLDENL
jgi:hypothetical protein